MNLRVDLKPKTRHNNPPKKLTEWSLLQCKNIVYLVCRHLLIIQVLIQWIDIRFMDRYKQNGMNIQCKYKLTVVEGDLKAPFSIATTLRCWGGRYSFPWHGINIKQDNINIIERKKDVRWSWSLEIDMPSQVQNLDKAIFISYNANTFGKDMNLTAPLSVSVSVCLSVCLSFSLSCYGYIVDQAGLFILIMTTGLGEGKLWIQTC